MMSHYTQIEECIEVRMSHDMLNIARELIKEEGFKDLGKLIEYLITRWVQDASKRKKE